MSTVNYLKGNATEYLKIPKTFKEFLNVFFLFAFDIIFVIIILLMPLLMIIHLFYTALFMMLIEVSHYSPLTIINNYLFFVFSFLGFVVLGCALFLSHTTTLTPP